jgi:endonuclease YncB( thermonuclease family)
MKGRLLIAAIIAALPVLAAQAQAPCPLAPIGSARVAAVRDGRTLKLADGRMLRLAAIEAPAGSGGALQTLVDGKTLRLARLGPDHDRYGRLVAFAFVGDAAQSLEQILLTEGAARVSDRIVDMACAAPLLQAERRAREARRGLWANPNFAPLAADNLARLKGERGHFALVEGTVLSVHPSGGTVYLNFGRYWTRDFSVLVSRRRARAFAKAGIALKQLAGHRILVRGWLEERRGPIVEADNPEQIELIGAQKKAARP